MSTYAEKYIKCFEKEIETVVLPSTSLFYCNDLYIDSLKSDCTYEISGLPSDMHEEKYKFNDIQRAKFNELLSICKSKCESLVKEKGLKGSPNTVIEEITHFYNETENKSIETPRKIFCYFAFLVELLLDNNKEPSALSEDQKTEVLSVYFGYTLRYGEIRYDGKDYTRLFVIKTLDELIEVAELFYKDNLNKKNLKDYDDLKSKQARVSFRYLYEVLKQFLQSDFLHKFTDKVKLAKIKTLSKLYNELY